jgi:hypothetical protein
MPRKGRFLEILVKQLQEFLGPQGLIIKSPELFYKDGKLIGEIDVTVRGKLGSSSIFIGIECRDRPKNGPQGIPWLTQIHGKQKLFNANKMIAVSTTGFTSESIRVDDELGIDLLAINKADDMNLSDWFKTIGFSWRYESWKISGQINLITEPNTIKGSHHFNMETPFLLINESNHLASIKELIAPDLDSLFAQLDDIESGITTKTIILEKSGHLQANIGNNIIIVNKLSIPLELSREVIHVGLLLNICQNINKDETMALTGHGFVETHDDKFQVLAIAKKSSLDPELRDLRINFLTEDGRPYTMPAELRLTLYGIME